MPVAIVAVGRPEIYTDALKASGIKVLHAISTPRHAEKAEAAGVDPFICEGFLSIDWTHWTPGLINILSFLFCWCEIAARSGKGHKTRVVGNAAVRIAANHFREG